MPNIEEQVQHINVRLREVEVVQKQHSESLASRLEMAEFSASVELRMARMEDILERSAKETKDGFAGMQLQYEKMSNASIQQNERLTRLNEEAVEAAARHAAEKQQAEKLAWESALSAERKVAQEKLDAKEKQLAQWEKAREEARFLNLVQRFIVPLMGLITSAAAAGGVLWLLFKWLIELAT